MSHIDNLIDDTETILVNPKRRKFSVSTPRHYALQRRHFFLFQIIPSIGAIAALVLLFWFPIGALELSLFFVLWFASAFGITLGYHRHLAHKSFKAKPWVRRCLMYLAFVAAQGPPVSWAAIHRLHHSESDKEEDPHSPNLHGSGWMNRLKGLAHAQIMWMRKHEYPSVTHYIPDLYDDKLMMKLDKHYMPVNVLGLAIPGLLGALYYQTFTGALMCFLWGGYLRMVVLDHIIWLINSILHTTGRPTFNTGDNSRNGYLLSLITLGESFHNNHHAFPGSAHFGLHWYNPDPGYYLLKLLEKLGLVWDIKVPKKKRISAKLKTKEILSHE